MSLAIWNNPVVISSFRNKRWQAFVFALAFLYLCFIAGLGIFILLDEDKLRVRSAVAYFYLLIILQWSMSFGWAGFLTAVSMVKETIHRTMDFQRLAPFGYRKFLIGKIFGEAAVVFYLAIATFPLAMVCWVKGAMTFELLLLTYVTIMTTTMMSACKGLCTNMENENGPINADRTGLRFEVDGFMLLIVATAIICALGGVHVPCVEAICSFVSPPIMMFRSLVEKRPCPMADLYGISVPILLVAPLIQLYVSYLFFERARRSLECPVNTPSGKPSAYITLLLLDLLAAALLFDMGLWDLSFGPRTAAFWLFHLGASLVCLKKVTPTMITWKSSILRSRGRKPTLADRAFGERLENTIPALICCCLGLISYTLLVLLPGIRKDGVANILLELPVALSSASLSLILILLIGFTYQWYVLKAGLEGIGDLFVRTFIIIATPHVIGYYLKVDWLLALSPSALWWNWFSWTPVSLNVIPLVIVYSMMLAYVWGCSHKFRTAKRSEVEKQIAYIKAQPTTLSGSIPSEALPGFDRRAPARQKGRRESRIANLLVSLCSNPIVRGDLQQEFRKEAPAVSWAGYFFLLIAGGSVLFYYRDVLDVPWERAYLAGVFSLQAFVLFIFSAGVDFRLGVEVSKKTLDFQRLTCLTPQRFLEGTILGVMLQPVRWTLASIPILIFCSLSGALDLALALFAYASITLSFAWAYAMFTFRRLERSHRMDSIAVLVLYIPGFALLFGLFGEFSRLFHIPWFTEIFGLFTPVPAIYGIYSGQPTFGFRFFGWHIPYLVAQPVAALALGYYFFQRMVRQMKKHLDVSAERKPTYFALFIIDFIVAGLIYERSDFVVPFGARSAGFWFVHLLVSILLIAFVTPEKDTFESWFWQYRGGRPTIKDYLFGARSPNGLVPPVCCAIGILSFFGFVFLPALSQANSQVTAGLGVALAASLVSCTMLIFLGTYYQYCQTRFNVGRALFAMWWDVLVFEGLCYIVAIVLGTWCGWDWLVNLSPIALFQEWLSYGWAFDGPHRWNVFPCVLLHAGLLVITWSLIRQAINQKRDRVSQKLTEMGVLTPALEKTQAVQEFPEAAPKILSPSLGNAGG